MSKTIVGTWITLILAVLLASASAEEKAKGTFPTPDPDKKVGVAASFEKSSVTPGSTATLEIRISTSFNWHIYATNEPGGFPTKLDPIEMPADWEAGAWKEPTPHPMTMPGLDLPLMVHDGSILFTRPIEIPADFPTGDYPIRGLLQYQVCDDKHCLIPDKLPFEATLTVAAAGGGDKATGDAEGDKKKEEKIPIKVDPRKQWGIAVDTDPKAVAPGGEAYLRVHVETGHSWHIYAIESEDPNIYVTRFDVPELPEGVEWVEGKGWSGPDPFPYMQPGMPPAPVHEGRVTFVRPVKVTGDAAKGDVEIKGSFSAMACDATSCLAPGNESFTATLTVDPEAKGAAPAVDYGTTSSADPITIGGAAGAATGGTGLWKILVTAILGAMVSWIMPCVYPMIPITISFFGKVAEEKHSNKTAVAASYGLGIAGTFISIGLVVGLLTMFVADASSRSGYASLGNVIATNPWINLAIGIVFILFALSMFGLFTIQVPSWLISKTDSAGRASRNTHIGAILLGITFALASFTCTVPVVGLLLGLAASGTAGGLASSLFGMVVYGAVFAAPFVLLSLFPSALSNMPKAGGWMETVKIGFGFLELAVAIKFLWVPDLEWGVGLLSRPVVLVLFTLIGVATIAYFLGLLKIGYTKVPAFRVSAGRWLASAATVLIMTPVGMSLAASPAYQTGNIPGWVSIGLEVLLPPAPAGDRLAELEGWFIDEYDEALAKAKAEGKALFIDFTGVYCGNCRAMENTVFPKEPVHGMLNQMVRTRLYVDRAEERHARFAKMQVERWKVASQPYYVVIDPNDESTIAEAGGFIKLDTFSTFLRQGLDRFLETRKSVASSR